MNNYDIPAEQKAKMLSNKINEFKTIIAQREIDKVVFTAHGKTDDALAAQVEIDNAKAAIDALLLMD